MLCGLMDLVLGSPGTSSHVTWLLAAEMGQKLPERIRKGSEMPKGSPKNLGQNMVKGISSCCFQASAHLSAQLS